jgi:flagellar protein FlaJ
VIDKKLILIILLSGIIAGLILTINFLYLVDIPMLFSAINIIAFFIFAFPIVIVRYLDYRKQKQLEELFPVFLRDFVESIRGGMTVPQAFKMVSKNDYKALTRYVRKMSSQMDWGITIDKVLLNFSNESKSKLIGRVVSSVVESHRFGGNLADTFEALSATSLEVERLRAERRLYLHSQMITGYIIFFVFLAVIIGLGKFLVPSMSEAPTGLTVGGTQVCSSFLTEEDCANNPTCQWSGGACVTKMAEEYKSVFRNLILIQGFFAGLTVGKMSEGAIIAGLKHSLFMMLVGGLLFTLFA